MNHALGVKTLVEAIDSRNRGGNLHDDLIAAEMTADQTRVGFGTWVIDLIRNGLAAIGMNRAGRPETLEQSVARLANISPHLLDDIGVNAEGCLPLIEDVHAGRGFVRNRLVEVGTDAAKPAATASRPTVQDDTSSGHPFVNIAAAE